MSQAKAAVLLLENSTPDALAAAGSCSCNNSPCVRPTLTDDELAGKHPAFFHCNGPCRDIAFQCAFPLHRDRLRNDLARHLAFDFDAFRADSAEAVNVGFAFNDDVSSADTAGNFA